MRTEKWRKFFKRKQKEECRCLEFYEESFIKLNILPEHWPVFLGKHPKCDAHHDERDPE